MLETIPLLIEMEAVGERRKERIAIAEKRGLKKMNSARIQREWM